MSILSTARFAIGMAKAQRQSFLSGLFWAAMDLRAEAFEAAYVAGLPPLLLADVSELPGLLGRAEYACKTQWFDFIKAGAIGDLLWQMNHEASQDWPELD
jgi:hypothetical protein